MPAEIDPPLVSLSERIAALKLAQNGELNGIPVPSGRPLRPRKQSQASLSSEGETIEHDPHDNQVTDNGNGSVIPRKPRLPSRPASFTNEDKPPLPSRRPSSSSVATIDDKPALPSRRVSRPISTVSTVSMASIDENEKEKEKERGKPSLPPRRPSTSSVNSTTDKPKPNRALPPPPPSPTLTPRIPTRPTQLRQEAMPESLPSRPTQLRQETLPAQSAKPPPTPRRPATIAEATPRPPKLPTRPVSSAVDENTPPPIPQATRPVIRKKQSINACFKCRDFSAPDHHATLYPREEYVDAPLDWIAIQLTEPFSSLTDKARAIFTWLHHNVEYDVYSFFNNCVKSQTPEETLASGLAVCEGYAGLFQAMAIASGLESVIIHGHGKGIGFTSMTETIPPFAMNHAWNAVRIDNGEWKLIDSCWGAGAVEGPNQPYKKVFCPIWFTYDNAEFGLKHYPQNRKHWYMTDIPTWEEYFIGDGEIARMAGGTINNFGLSEYSILPRSKAIDLASGDTHIRFQFSNVCEHWYDKYGEQRVFILAINGANGKNDWLPFQKHEYTWYIDVPIRQLGKPGQQVSLNVVDTIDGKKVQNLTVQEYLAAKGRKAMSWQGFVHWDLV